MTALLNPSTVPGELMGNNCKRQCGLTRDYSGIPVKYPRFTREPAAFRTLLPEYLQRVRRNLQFMIRLSVSNFVMPLFINKYIRDLHRYRSAPNFESISVTICVVPLYCFTNISKDRNRHFKWVGAIMWTDIWRQCSRKRIRSRHLVLLRR